MISSQTRSNKITDNTVFSTIKNQQLKPITLQKSIEESIVMSLFSLADTLLKKGEWHCQRYGITMLQYQILLYLAGDPNIEYIEENRTDCPIVASELAEAMNVSRPNITNLLNLLIEKNLVRQIKKENDWRRKYLVLTDEGWALIEKMHPIKLRINQMLLAHLSEKEKACFLGSLRMCIDLLKHKECQ